MPRRIQDIVPNNHRSIRDIPLERNSITAPIQPPKAGGRKQETGRKLEDTERDVLPEPAKKAVAGRKKTVSEPESLPDEDIPDQPPAQISEIKPRRVSFTPPARTEPKKGKKWVFILLAIILVVATVGYFASVYFSHATFNIAPKITPIAVDGTYVLENSSGTSTFKYTLSTLSGTASATVPASDGPKVSTNAKGSITISNSYSAQPQQLKAGTRFTDDTGRIYRLSSSIVVPGYTTTGGTIVPKSITTTVVADAPGQSYNISRTDSVSDFKIVAYKGTPRYDTLYGRLATDISGGFVGTKKTIVPGLLASTTADIQTKIKTSLIGQVQSVIPEGYIMLDNAYTTSFGAPVITGDDPKSAVITIKGTLNAILIKKDQLIRHIATKQRVDEFGNYSFTAPGIEMLDFTIGNPKEFSAEKKNKLIIKLKGVVTLVGTVPVDELKSKLAGASLSETTDILRAYKPVLILEKSSGQIIPPWSKVPSDLSRIEIRVLTE